VLVVPSSSTPMSTSAGATQPPSAWTASSSASSTTSAAASAATSAAASAATSAAASAAASAVASGPAASPISAPPAAGGASGEGCSPGTSRAPSGADAPPPQPTHSHGTSSIHALRTRAWYLKNAQRSSVSASSERYSRITSSRLLSLTRSAA